MRIAAAIDRERGSDDSAQLSALVDALEAELALLAPHLRSAS